MTGGSLGEAPVPSGTTRIAGSPDGAFLYASKSFSPASTITVISTATNQDVGTITVGSGSHAAAVSPDGSRLYAVNRPDQTVSVVDTATRTVTATVPVGGTQPQEVTVSPDGREVYVTHNGGVTVIDAATNSTAVIPVTGAPATVAFAPDDTHAYVTNSASLGNPGLAVIDTATRTITGTVPLGGPTFALVVSPDGKRAYAARSLDKRLSDIDLDTLTVTDTIVFTGQRPQRLGLTPDARRLYVTRSSGGDGYSLSTIDTATNTIISNSDFNARIRDVAIGTPPTADLGLSLDAAPRPGVNGRIDYTVTATNNGPSSLTTATVTVDVPAGATSNGCQIDGTKATCTVTSLNPGASTTRQISVPVSALSLGTPYTVTATRTASTPTDTDAANDTAARTCTATTPLLINCD
ncbi:cell surface protein [Streptomyces sp. NPDC094466]|uniref:cell surface protein n=1 Tax=Streptomyces sp. NPDC094466 TaxID=3366065 RepID=UPI003826DFE5